MCSVNLFLCPPRPPLPLTLELLPWNITSDPPSPNDAQHKSCYSQRAAGRAPSWPVGIPSLPAFPGPNLLESPFCFLDFSEIISCPTEIPSVTLPGGVYFASDRNMASSPLLWTSLPHFSGTCQYLKLQTDLRGAALKSGLSVNPPSPTFLPPFCCKMQYFFERFKEGSLSLSLSYIGPKVNSLKGSESQSEVVGAQLLHIKVSLLHSGLLPL